MSPLQIEMLLHIHWRLERYDDRGGEAQRSALDYFLDNGLIEQCHDGSQVFDKFYRCTERGSAMVARLCAVPLPVRAWI